MDESAAETRVEWREWGQEPFDVAARTGKPVLLSLSATWCSHCHAMDRETYDEPRIAANVNDGFVPVRVDVDRHPRVRERYNMGGFPSTVFLTPEGELLTGAGYLGEDGMRQVITSVRKMWDGKGTEAGRIPRGLQGNATPSGTVTEAIESEMLTQLRATQDQVNGGWGDAEKFPMPRTVEFALKRDRAMALRNLDAVDANLLDGYGGGFFRFAENPDWSDPHHEKLLDTNAALCRAFANAYLYTGDEEYREPAAETVDFLTTTLWTGAAFAGSQSAGDGSEYYALEPTEREAAAAPPVDGTVFADRNAVAIDALLTYAAYTDDETARRYAERALDVVRSDLIDEGEVVHYRDGDETGESGLLLDHARVVAALTTAREILGPDALDGEVTALARDLADYALDALQSAGSFVDGPLAGAGLLDHPLRPLDGNVEMADALLDLAAITGEERYAEAAAETVAAFAGAADRLGPRVAGYASVASRVLRPGLRIDVTAPTGSDLHRAALRVADHEKVVVPDATDPAYDDNAAYVVVGDRVSEPAREPGAVGARVAELTE